MSEQNRAMVRRTFEEIWNRGNESIFEERFARDYIGHSFTDVHGPEGGRQFAAMLHHAFPDFHYTVEDEIAEGDRVAQRWTARGTHDGEFQGIPPTGEQVTMTGISIYRVANDKLVEGWTNVDMLGLLHQIGAAPVPERP
jgi:predicted ester cyclase